MSRANAILFRCGLVLGLPGVAGLLAALDDSRTSTARGEEPTASPASRPAPVAANAPDEAQFKQLNTWIIARAPFCLPATQPAATAATSTRPADRSLPGAGDSITAPDAAAVASLRTHLIHVEQVARDSNRLSVDFSAVAGTTKDADVPQLLAPVLPWIEAVSLGRCQVGDETAAFLARAPRLAYLDLSGTQVTDAGVAGLSRLGRLRELVLVRTHLTDAAVEPLTAMPALKRVFLWKSGLSKAALAQLRQRRPGLRVDAGDSPGATTREAEPDFKLTGEAPPPRAPGAAQTQPAVAAAPPQTQPAAAPQAVNALCPVSGKPVDPRYTVVYQGRVIGFCCPNCPAQFWADPARFEGKLSAAAPADRAP